MRESGKVNTASTAGAAETEARDGALPSGRRGWLIVAALLGAAFIIRLIVVIDVAGDYRPLNDAEHYDHIAVSITSGDGFGEAQIAPMTGPSAFRAPLYPVSLAAVYTVFGKGSYTAGLLANALIGVGLVAVIGLLASMLWTRRVGAVALGLAAVHPSLALIGSSLQHEPLLAFLTVGAVAAAVQHGRSSHAWRWAAATGALLGLAGLTRELGLLAAPPLAVLLWQQRPAGLPRCTPKAFAAPALAAVMAVAVITPWTIRNAVQLDSFVPVSTSSGFGLTGTFNETSVDAGGGPTTWGRWIRPYEDPAAGDIMLSRLREIADLPDEAYEDEQLLVAEMERRGITMEDIGFSEAELDSELSSYAMGVIRDNPTYLAKVAIGNSIRMLDLDGGDYNRNFIARYVPYPMWLTWLSIMAGIVMAALAVYGATRRWARIPGAVWAVPIVAIAFIVVVLPASIRYRGGSIEPFVVLFAAVAIWDLAQRFGVVRAVEARFSDAS